MTGTGPAEYSDDALHDERVLVDLLSSTKAVIFDFDGPVCDLFGGASTASVAAEVKQAARRAWGVLDPDVEGCDDLHGILRCLRNMYDRPAAPSRGPGLLDEAERIVARQEFSAVETAVETPHIAALLELLLDLDMDLIVVSDNAEGPVREYLERHGLARSFQNVFGRNPHDARLMKPHPDCLERARTHLGLPASACLFVGDQLNDIKAVRSDGMHFLGYTQDRAKAGAMRENNADAVVDSYLPVIDAAEKIRNARWSARRQAG